MTLTLRTVFFAALLAALLSQVEIRPAQAQSDADVRNGWYPQFPAIPKSQVEDRIQCVTTGSGGFERHPVFWFEADSLAETEPDVRTGLPASRNSEGGTLAPWSPADKNPWARSLRRCRWPRRGTITVCLARIAPVIRVRSIENDIR